ncbi:MAG: uL15 family ribosomal protein, partial [Deltaproteobacteria bacterium]
NRVETFPINVELLEKEFEAGATVDLTTLRAKGIIPKLVERVKILAEGVITKKLSIKVHGVSASAKEKIEKAGGSVEIIETTVPPAA